MRGVVEFLEKSLSGQRAQHHVSEITGHYRSPGSAGYHAVIDYVAEYLGQLGITYETRSFPLDGKAEVGGERTPPAWEPIDAKLELVATGEVLASWHQAASCLPWWCPATSPEGVVLEVVDVGTGLADDDYTGKDVAGKAVLVHDSGENVAWPELVNRAVRYGATGIITNYLIYQYAPWRTREGSPDLVQQLRLPAGWKNPWTFCVSQTAFRRLTAAAEREAPVTARFTVNARTFAGTSRSVIATIPGSELSEEGVLLVAHVTAATMPGANCASGVALLLELARAISEGIASRTLARPRRSLHFMFANEGMGSLELADHDPTLLKRLLAAFAVCSVGHDQNKTKSALVVGRAPDALPTVANDLVEALIGLLSDELPWAYRGERREIPYVRWKVLPYTPWSDNVTWSKLGVPSLLFMSLPDRYFHTQFLTTDETDPFVFVACGAVLGASAILIADAGWPNTGELLRVVAAHAERRLDDLGLEALAYGEPTRGNAARTLGALDYCTSRDVARLHSTLGLVPERGLDEATALVAALERRLRTTAERVRADIAAQYGEFPTMRDESGTSTVIPVPSGLRSPHGVPGFTYADMTRLVQEMRGYDPTVVVESLQVVVDGIWSRCDGTADIAAITRSVGHEFEFNLSPEHVYRLVSGLERDGFVRLTEPTGGHVFATPTAKD